MKKMMNKILLATAFSLMIAPAQARQYAVGTKVGTLGLGLEGTMKINEFCNVSAVVNGFKLNIHDRSQSQLKDGLGLRMLTAGALFNLHPYKNGFKISAGAFYNGNRLSFSGKSTKSAIIDRRVYSTDIETDGHLEFNKVSPYLGIGYDSSLYGNNPWSFTCEAGVLYQGKIRGKINKVSGVAANDIKAFNDLAKDQETGFDTPWTKFYPVVSVGIKYSF